MYISVTSIQYTLCQYSFTWLEFMDPQFQVVFEYFSDLFKSFGQYTIELKLFPRKQEGGWWSHECFQPHITCTYMYYTTTLLRADVENHHLSDSSLNDKSPVFLVIWHDVVKSGGWKPKPTAFFHLSFLSFLEPGEHGTRSSLLYLVVFSMAPGRSVIDIQQFSIGTSHSCTNTRSSFSKSFQLVPLGQKSSKTWTPPCSNKSLTKHAL